MTARFGGKCRACGGRINPGDRIIFRSKGNSIHAACDPGNRPDAESEKGSAAPEVSRPNPAGDTFVIDWPELQRITLEAMNGNFRSFPKSSDTARYYCDARASRHVSDSFLGYSLAQAKDWLENGYQDEALEGLEDFAPPIREKRRFVYAEEGDEIDLSAAWSGEDNFMTTWTKRDTIPGVKLEFEIHFVNYTPAALINRYERWIARAVEAIEAAGIDPEVNITFPGEKEWLPGRNSNTLVRVKRENETVDLHSWSAMLSPATFRTFGFVAIIAHGEARGKHTSTGISHSHNGTKWNVLYDAEEGAIRTECPYTPTDFPEEEMTRLLKKAIEDLKRGIGD